MVAQHFNSVQMTGAQFLKEMRLRDVHVMDKRILSANSMKLLLKVDGISLRIISCCQLSSIAAK